MKNELLVEIIKERLRDMRVNAEYKLQQNVVCEVEDKFLDGFEVATRQEYLNLDIEKGKLQLIEIDQIILFVIKFLKEFGD